jgi:hypothetical protein
MTDMEAKLVLEDSLDTDAAVAVTLGYVSACWSNLAGAGVFESDRAEQARIELQRFIEERTQSRVGALQSKDRDATKSEVGISEFGRGYEEGKAEASDRQLRAQALALALDGNRNQAPERIAARAKNFLKFLESGE